MKTEEAKQKLDAHVREIIAWHLSPQTGCPFWLEYASKLRWNPRIWGDGAGAVDDADEGDVHAGVSRER